MMILVDTDVHVMSAIDSDLVGFIAGTGNGIVTVNGQPDQKRIVLFERTHNLPVVRQTWSNPDGTYLMPCLSPNKLYLVMAVDDKQQYEPVAWDFIKPAVPDA